MSVFHSSARINPPASSEDLSSSAITGWNRVPAHSFDSWQFLILIMMVFAYIYYLPLNIYWNSFWAAFGPCWADQKKGKASFQTPKSHHYPMCLLTHANLKFGEYLFAIAYYNRKRQLAFRLIFCRLNQQREWRA